MDHGRDQPSVCSAELPYKTHAESEIAGEILDLTLFLSKGDVLKFSSNFIREVGIR